MFKILKFNEIRKEKKIQSPKLATILRFSSARSKMKMKLSRIEKTKMMISLMIFRTPRLILQSVMKELRKESI